MTVMRYIRETGNAVGTPSHTPQRGDNDSAAQLPDYHPLAVPPPKAVVDALRCGHAVILLDPGGAVLTQPAVTVTAAGLHFAIRHSSGLIHAAMPSADLDRLRIPVQQVLDTENSGRDFTVAVDATTGIGTGISAADRARTVRVTGRPAQHGSRSHAPWACSPGSL